MTIKKQKIVFVLPDMPGGGTERVVANLANKYVDWGYLVDIMLFAGEKVAYELDNRVNIVIVGRKSSGSLFTRFSRIKKMRSYYKKNLGCHIFAFSNMGCVFSVIAAAGLPYEMLVSERNDPRMVPLKHKIVRDWAYRKANCLVVQTEEVLGLFGRSLQKKACVIANPVGSDIPPAHDDIATREKKVVNVARLENQKNHKLLLEAFSVFYKNHCEYTLEIYGKGSMLEELERFTVELGIVEVTRFHGFSKNVREDIKTAAMFVLSSDYEGISNSMIEAMAMGIPTISTDCPVGGARGYILNGVNGILTPVGDIQAMADAMARIADNQEFANELSKNAILVKEKFSLDLIAKQFLQAANII